jgi:hypothetical protein
MRCARRRARDQYFPLTMVVAMALLAFTTAPAALAAQTCDNQYYHVGAKSLNANYTAITSGITDPSASSVPGDSTNSEYHDHIILWDDIHQDSVPGGTCGSGNPDRSSCWLQAGVGMGFVGFIGGTNATNWNDSYQPYMEDFGLNGSLPAYHVFFYPNISINQNGAPRVSVFYTGNSGSGGNPEFEADLLSSNGTWYVLGHGYLPYAAGHAKAIAEVEVYGAVNTDCPTLTNGAPYQNFGTDSAGQVTSIDKINLTNSSGTGPWSGSPETFGLNGLQYWLTELSDWPASFKSNGPASGPP